MTLACEEWETGKDITVRQNAWIKGLHGLKTHGHQKRDWAKTENNKDSFRGTMPEAAQDLDHT